MNNALTDTRNESSSSSNNSYVELINGPNWDFMAAFYIITIILAVSTNATVLGAFLCRQSLRTPFNLYLINLLSANILRVVLETTPELLNHLYSGWWLGDGYCSVLVFGLYFTDAGVQNCHILIAINRIWAVCWPYSYRTTHTRRVALLMCLAGWAEVCAMVLPGFILDTVYYRADPVKNGCSLNIAAQWTWSVVVQFLLYNMGLEAMWVAYPIIWYKRRQTQKIVPATVQTVHSLTNGRKNSSREGDQQGRAVIINDNSDDVGESMQENRTAGSGTVPSRRKKSSKAFNILTLLTISVTVCWTPVHVIYTLLLWLPFDRIGSLLLNIAVVLVSLQTLIDPILFVCTLPDLRNSFRN
ncbi:hypothetical protein BV898_17382 [Hypsibius exemplaris]|uniref:G-protein coupled receptors family 1 profile domain-containing protein n=1 Tax=Hypsibius exemplaris TaxID=2072580 RepID=A0A9X6RME5_HYPEX|nr:hypothetical protein BV898_17382 [Hypsibius exemplaris]